jgi:predicted AAA+ superfamily ATPase
MSFYKRWQKKIIEEGLQNRRVILLGGPRQCGKTTISKELISKDISYRTLDDIALMQAATNDPHGFIKHETKTLIIDEIQRAPSLLMAIKKAVDEDTRPGQYLLTGSANIGSLPNVQESLAGRVMSIRLHPLAQGEIEGSLPSFLFRAFSESFETPRKQYDREAILEIACRGGFPEAVQLTGRARQGWHKDYMNALLERDLKDISKIQRKDAMQQLVNTLAAWSSKFLDISALGSGIGVQRPTLESYINSLETLYLIERIKPWVKTDYQRVGKKDKLFMADSGLMRSILNWSYDQLRFDGDRSGKLIETFAFNEIIAQIDANRGEYELYHYRDREQREIDFLIEREDGALLGIEIKAGSSVNKSSFAHLKWFQENIAQDRKFIGIVLYTGELPVPFGKHLWAIPFGTLWP